MPAATYSSSRERYDSTYTYTNAVPQKKSFNTGMWAQFERRIRRYARHQCTKPIKQNGLQVAPPGILYLLTGTSSVRIQRQQQQNQVVGVNVDMNQVGNVDLNMRISRPNSLWTAGCCVRENNNQWTRSFAVMGNNVAGHQQNLQLTSFITVQRLQLILAVDAHTLNNVNINLFPGNNNCLRDIND